MKVKILNYTPNMEQMVATAARVCYDKEGDIDNILESLTPEKTEKFLKKMLTLQNPGTVWEHCTVTFGIEGVSRALSHQLVRHRAGCSYDQRSQRYIREKQFDYVVPDSISKNPAAVTLFNRHMKDVQTLYDTLIEKYGVHQEDARAVLPNACCTSLVVTMNLRALSHLWSLRCCTRAQKEIRTLANEMLRLCREEISPLIFNSMGAACKVQGFCPEGHMSCGAYPTLEELKNASNQK